MEAGVSSLFPPLLAVGLAVFTRQIHLSLWVGILAGTLVIEQGNLFRAFTRSIEEILRIGADPGNARVLAFSLGVGGLLALIQRSGGFHHFREFLERRKWVKGPRSAQFLTVGVGIGIFIESTITCLVAGAVSRASFDRFKVSRQKLAYLVDSTSAPICILIPLNAWGAFVLQVLADQGVEKPTEIFVQSIGLNFYPILTLIFVFWIIFWGRDFGPMKKAGRLKRERSQSLDFLDISPILKSKLGFWNMVIPMGGIIFMMPVFLWITGEGKWMEGSGSKSVLWSVLLATLISAILIRTQRLMKTDEIVKYVLFGMKELLPVVLILLLAFGIGGICRELGTGNYIAEMTRTWMTPTLLPPVVFIVACFISFSTGTSWGTFAIVIPLMVPVVHDSGASLPLALAAALGGGVFGDHCSPISDTTIISSLSAGCDPISHVNTQLPYALIPASLSLVLYFLLGFF